MSNDKQKIWGIYQKIDDAMINKNTKLLSTLLDSNYILQHMSGYQQSKKEWIEQIENEEMRYFKTMPQKTKIIIESNTAILNCDTKIDARIYGIRHTWGMTMEMHFKKNGEEWIPVSAIATSN